MLPDPFNTRIAAVARREYLERVTNTWFVVATFLIPVGLILIVLLSSLLVQPDASGGSLRVAVLEGPPAADGAGRSLAGLSEFLVGRDSVYQLVRPATPATGLGSVGSLADPDAPKVTFVSSSRPAPPRGLPPSGIDSLRVTGADAYLLVPDSVGRQPVTVYATRSMGVAEESAIERSVRRATLAYLLSEARVESGAADRLLRASELDVSVSRISGDGTRSQSVVRSVALGGGALLYMLLLVYGQMIVRSVMEEKNSNIVEVLLSSIRPWELMSGKIVGVAAVGLTQTLVWGLLAAGVVLYALSSPGAAGVVAELDLQSMNLPYARLGFAFFGYFLLGYFLYAAIFAATGAMVGSESDSQQVALPVMLLIVSAFVLLVPMINAPQATWSRIVSQVPVFSPILMLARVTAGTATAVEIALSVVLLLAAIVLTTWISGRVYRLGILMQGKRPNLPELVRWIRYG